MFSCFDTQWLHCRSATEMKMNRIIIIITMKEKLWDACVRTIWMIVQDLLCFYHHINLWLLQGDRGRSGPPGPNGEPGLKVSSLLQYCLKAGCGWIMVCFGRWKQCFILHSVGRVSVTATAAERPLWIGFQSRIKGLCGVFGQGGGLFTLPEMWFCLRLSVTQEPR